MIIRSVIECIEKLCDRSEIGLEFLDLLRLHILDGIEIHSVIIDKRTQGFGNIQAGMQVLPVSPFAFSEINNEGDDRITGLISLFLYLFILIPVNRTVIVHDSERHKPVRHYLILKTNKGNIDIRIFPEL